MVHPIGCRASMVLSVQSRLSGTSVDSSQPSAWRLINKALSGLFFATMRFLMKTIFYPAAIIILLLSIVGCHDGKDNQLQKGCAKHCEAYFTNAYGDGVFDDQEHSGSVFYKCHYHKSMNKCFIMLDENGYKRRDDKLYKMKSLWDLGEKKKYGFFYNMGTSTVCEVLEKKCKSEKEWDSLVKTYIKE